MKEKVFICNYMHIYMSVIMTTDFQQNWVKKRYLTIYNILLICLSFIFHFWFICNANNAVQSEFSRHSLFHSLFIHSCHLAGMCLPFVCSPVTSSWSSPNASSSRVEPLGTASLVQKFQGRLQFLCHDAHSHLTPNRDIREHIVYVYPR